MQRRLNNESGTMSAALAPRWRRLLDCLMVSGFVTALGMPAQATDEPIWTTKPVRIDRSKQDYERIPSRNPEKLKAEQERFLLRLPQQISMKDSGTFLARGKKYVLADIRPLSLDKVCTSEIGSHWRCGRSAATFSGKLLRGQLLQCAKASREGNMTHLTECKAGSRNIEEEIIRNGQGFAVEPDSPLQQSMTEAREARTGVWRDQTCFETKGDC